jgi:molybdenum cofactor synthesis domain-containing protein
MIATRHGDTPVKKGDKLAGTRVIPLVIEKEKMEAVRQLAGEHRVFQILPYCLKTAGVVATGSEVQKGLIKDTFTPVIINKLAEYGIEVKHTATPGDDNEVITEEILKMADAGVDMVICTGGMSVDPDDRTPLAIRNTGARIVTYGAPVLPGAMFLLSYLERNGREIPVMGLPGCVMYAGRTIVDLMLPRIAAKDPVTAEEIAALGEGGLCLNCKVCTWPNCGFGKGC